MAARGAVGFLGPLEKTKGLVPFSNIKFCNFKANAIAVVQQLKTYKPHSTRPEKAPETLPLPGGPNSNPEKAPTACFCCNRTCHTHTHPCEGPFSFKSLGQCSSTEWGSLSFTSCQSLYFPISPEKSFTGLFSKILPAHPLNLSFWLYLQRRNLTRDALSPGLSSGNTKAKARQGWTAQVRRNTEKH